MDLCGWLAVPGQGVDREVLDEALGAAGAIIIGRRMYDVVDGWGDSSPFDRPVFVVTSRPHPHRVAGKTSYTFVTGGIHDALAQAEQAAGGQDISVGGGASVIQQFLAAGLVGQLNLHLSPVLLGSGKRLFENLGGRLPALEQTWVRESPNATHLQYRVRPVG